MQDSDPSFEIVLVASTNLYQLYIKYYLQLAVMIVAWRLCSLLKNKQACSYNLYCCGM